MQLVKLMNYLKHAFRALIILYNFKKLFYGLKFINVFNLVSYTPITNIK